jgi:hypothetical protein
MLRATLVCLIALVALPAAAAAAQAPPGAVRSDNLEYVTRVPGTGAVDDGRFYCPLFVDSPPQLRPRRAPAPGARPPALASRAAWRLRHR